MQIETLLTVNLGIVIRYKRLQKNAPFFPAISNSGPINLADAYPTKHTHPLLISTGFLKYPLELKKKFS